MRLEILEFLELELDLHTSLESEGHDWWRKFFSPPNNMLCNIFYPEIFGYNAKELYDHVYYAKEPAISARERRKWAGNIDFLRFLHFTYSLIFCLSAARLYNVNVLVVQPHPAGGWMWQIYTPSIAPSEASIINVFT